MIPVKDYPGERRLFPTVMIGMLVLNLLVFAYEVFGAASARDLDRLFSAAGVVPVEFTRGAQIGEPPPLGFAGTTLFTSMFLHGGLLHLASNMLYLFIFGDNVEDRLGHIRFLIFYLTCGVIAGLTHVLFNAGSTVPSVGASGAIAGVLAAYLRLFPTAEVRTLLFLGPFIVVPRLPAALLILFWFVTQFLSGVLALGTMADQTAGIAFWAHIGGFVAGFVLVQVFAPRRRPEPSVSW